MGLIPDTAFTVREPAWWDYAKKFVLDHYPGREEAMQLAEGVSRSGAHSYKALCPAHDDSEASLGVRETDNGILLNCYAGCSTESVVSALGLQMRDLFFEPRQATTSTSSSRR